jgi:hypothetical protein
MKRVLAGGLVAAVALGGCSLRTQGLALSTQVALQVSNPELLALPGPLWGAVVWVGAGGLETTAVAPLQADGGVVLFVEAPADFAQLDAGPIDVLTFEGVGVYRPRLIVFEDVNHSGTFDFDGLDAGAGDRVVGVDVIESEAYAPNPDAMLQAFSPEETDSYYAATGGVFTPYLRVTLNSQDTLDLDAPAPVPISLTEGPAADVDLACQRGESLSSLSLEQVLDAPESVVINAGLNAAQLCGKAASICVQESLDGQAPEVTPVQLDDRVLFVQCQAVDELESVITVEAVDSCDGCNCNWTTTAQAYVVASSARPSWWPCGVGVEYCQGSGNLLALSEGCVSLPP